MADGYWGHQPAALPSAPTAKRPRQDYDLPPGDASGQGNYHYLPRDDNHAGFYGGKDTKAIEESYERYLQNAQRPSFVPGETGNFSGTGTGTGGRVPDNGGGMHSLRYGDPATMSGPGRRPLGPDMSTNGRGTGFGGELPMEPMVRQAPLGREIPLPPDASNTVFVEGLPRDVTQREVAHIFRPFLGYKDVRKVTKEPKYHNADPVVLCFVDFKDAACAMVAINALQGYKLDEADPESPALRLQFSRHPGPRPSFGSRGRRDR